jgi:hypothetical protein
MLRKGYPLFVDCSYSTEAQAEFDAVYGSTPDMTAAFTLEPPITVYQISMALSSILPCIYPRRCIPKAVMEFLRSLSNIHDSMIEDMLAWQCAELSPDQTTFVFS